MAYYLIKVKGNILANDKLHFAQGWACYGKSEPTHDDSNYYFDEKNHNIESDLILNETRRAVPYAVYLSEKGISIESTGDISCCPGYQPALEYYKENIAKTLNFLNIEYDNEITQTIYKSLFIDVFSILELLLSDLILCLIYSNEIIFNNAKDYFINKPTNKKNNNNVEMIEQKVHNFFFKNVVYHKFDEVKKIYKKLIGIEIPNFSKLKICLYKRNNIVHRYSFSNIDRMGVTIISKDDVKKLIEFSDNFVNELVKIINDKHSNFTP